MPRENAAVEEFRRRAAKCITDAELGELLAEASREIGFDFFALSYAQGLDRSSPRLIGFDNYPQSWAERMIGRRLFVDDPILHASLRANCGFEWSELPKLLVIHERHRAVLDGGARAGLRRGFTVPANVPFEPTGSCSFATPKTRSLRAWQLEAAELIGGHALKIARRLHGWPQFPPSEVKLSPREIEVLHWVARGKSNTDIAAIIGIGPQTVKSYVATILTKIGVADRTQAALTAARWGLISTADAIPPIGGIPFGTLA